MFYRFQLRRYLHVCNRHQCLGHDLLVFQETCEAHCILTNRKPLFCIYSFFLEPVLLRNIHITVIKLLQKKRVKQIFNQFFTQNFLKSTYAFHFRISRYATILYMLIMYDQRRLTDQAGSFLNRSTKQCTLPKKWSFPVRISSINVTESQGNCKFGHIYWGRP